MKKRLTMRKLGEVLYPDGPEPGQRDRRGDYALVWVKKARVPMERRGRIVLVLEEDVEQALRGAAVTDDDRSGHAPRSGAPKRYSGQSELAAR